jgi:hypothetical protein
MDISEHLKKIGEWSQNQLNSLLTVEIYESLTEDQKKLIDEAKNALNLEGDISEKSANLNNLINKINGLYNNK